MLALCATPYLTKPLLNCLPASHREVKPKDNSGVSGPEAGCAWDPREQTGLSFQQRLGRLWDSTLRREEKKGKAEPGSTLAPPQAPGIKDLCKLLTRRALCCVYSTAAQSRAALGRPCRTLGQGSQRPGSISRGMLLPTLQTCKSNCQREGILPATHPALPQLAASRQLQHYIQDNFHSYMTVSTAGSRMDSESSGAMFS